LPCIGFAAIAGILIYLTKKQKDLEEENLFKINTRTSGRAAIFRAKAKMRA
jgi:hypothetical protein